MINGESQQKNRQAYIDKLAKKYKNKNIIVYGAGSFSNMIFENYDLSKLHIIAVADKKFETQNHNTFFNIKCISPDEISKYKADVILIANADFTYFKKIVKKIAPKNIKIDRIVKDNNPNGSFLQKFSYIFYCIKYPENYIYKLSYKFASLITKNSQERNKIYNHIFTTFFGSQVLLKAKSVGKNFWCSSFSTVNSNTILKNNVCFNGMKITGGGKVTIGNYFHCGTECMIITQSHNYDTGKAIPYDNEKICKEVIIEDFVWFGSRVTILPGTEIGEGAIIQAGAVVHGKIPPYAIVGGNPAKVFKYRDIEHFKKLKSEGKFY